MHSAKIKYAFIIASAALFSVPGSAVAQSATSCRNVTAYGADPTGVASSNAAFTSAINSTDGVHICIYFPAGRYTFTAQALTSLAGANPTASVTIEGDGSETTELRFTGGVDGLVINMNAPGQSFHISKLSVQSGSTSNTSNGILINNFSRINTAQSHIQNVTVRGSDGYNATFRWGYGINLFQMSNVNLDSVTVVGSSDTAAYASAGTCLFDRGTASVVPVQINISLSQFNYCKYGIMYGNYLQGLQITSTNFVGNTYGVYVPTGQNGNDQLAINNSQFNNSVSDVYIGSLIDGVTINGNDFYGGQVPGSVPIQIDTSNQFSIVGNTFINTGVNSSSQDAIRVGNYGGASGIITGNVFSGPFVTAIWLKPGSQRVNVQSNSYSGPTNTVINQGSNNTVGGGSS
jgi:hypothetical protein